MAHVDFADTAPFAGWEQLRQDLTSLGPQRVLRTLLMRVYDEMKTSDGIFQGGAAHNYVSHPILVRAAIRAAADSSITLDTTPEPLSAESEQTLRQLLAQLNELARTALRARRPKDFDGLPPASPERVDRVADILWSETLRSRGRANSFKHELGRAWLFLRTYWEELKREVKGAVDLALREPLDSAFDSLECAIALNVVVYQYGGWVPDMAAVLANTTFARSVNSVLGWYAEDAVSVAGDWSDIELFSHHGVETVFHDSPLLKIGAAGLLAPDLAMSFAGIADRLLSRSLANYEVNGDKILESARTVLGLVFERYVQALIEECARVSAVGQFQSEFELADRTRSPDAFLVDRGICCAFEAKATRFPSPVRNHASVGSFMQWLREITGERPPKRKPLEQGSRFFERWRAGDVVASAKLGIFNGLESVWYVIVAHEDLPLFVHWEPFRNLRWRPLLGAAEQALDTRTIFVSIRDMEALVGALKWLQEAGKPSNAHAIITNWRATWANNEAIAAGSEYKPSLRSYVLAQFPRSAGAIPTTLDIAFRQCWEVMQRTLFDLP